jgi:hypothetical protein
MSMTSCLDDELPMVKTMGNSSDMMEYGRG